MRALLSILAFAMALPASADCTKKLQVPMAAALERAVDDAEAEITVASLEAAQRKVLCAAKSVRALDVLPGERPYGRVTARATLAMPDGSERRVFVMADVEVEVPVWVTSRRIRRGAPIDEYSLTRRMRSLNGLSPSALRASEPVLGQVAKRTLAKDRVLVRSAMTSPTLVRRGETVSVTSMVGLVRVRARGEALGNGRVGDRVNVRINRRRVVSGEISARGEVVIR